MRALLPGQWQLVEMSRAVRGADWFNLAYANQRPDQKLIAFMPAPRPCVERFDAPAETSLPEGALLELQGIVDCADSYQWSVIAGPDPRRYRHPIPLHGPLWRIRKDPRGTREHPEGGHRRLRAATGPWVSAGWTRGRRPQDRSLAGCARPPNLRRYVPTRVPASGAMTAGEIAFA